jgi:hypothetical protein
VMCEKKRRRTKDVRWRGRKENDPSPARPILFLFSNYQASDVFLVCEKEKIDGASVGVDCHCFVR